MASCVVVFVLTVAILGLLYYFIGDRKGRQFNSLMSVLEGHVKDVPACATSVQAAKDKGVKGLTIQHLADLLNDEDCAPSSNAIGGTKVFI